MVLAKQNLAELDSAPLVRKEVEAPCHAALPPCLEDELTREVWGQVAWLELYTGLVPLTDPAEAKYPLEFLCVPPCPRSNDPVLFPQL